MRKRVEFRLTMPSCGSWNGQWSQEKSLHTKICQIKEDKIEKLGIVNGTSWYYNFGDGWGASISARVMEKGERAKKSAGFCGYDWMIDSIIEHNKIRSIVGEV